MNKIACIAGLSFLALSTASWSNGFYIGAGVGPEFTEFNQDATVKQVNPLNQIPLFDVSDKELFSGMGYFGSLFAGYGYTCRQLYLGGEVNVNMSNSEFESSNHESVHSSFSDTSYEINRSYGISFIPGFQYTPCTLFFARLGYTNGHFKVRTNDTSLTDVSRNIGGFRYGIGIRQALLPCLDIVFDYSRIDYTSTRFVVVDNFTTKNTRITPKTSQAELGIIYKFA